MSLGDYTVMNALSSTDGHRMQLTSLATMIGWERSRLSHHLQRMTKRGLVERVQSETDGRATDAVLTDRGWKSLKERPQSTSPGCDGCSSPISTAARRSNSPTS